VHIKSASVHGLEENEKLLGSFLPSLREHVRLQASDNYCVLIMKTIEVTIDEALLSEIDVATRALDISRETFIYAALQRALREQAMIALEQQHAQGYIRHPPRADEFDGWEAEQVWGEP
jgi:hypothetical protein